MKASIKAIIAASATAALSLGVAAVALAEPGVDENNQIVSEVTVKMPVEKVYTPFDEKVLSCFGTYEDAKNNKREDGNVEIKLDSLTVEECGFNVNGARFFLTAPEGFGSLFNEPKSFELIIGANGKMTAKPAYINNPMRVKIVITFDKNGEKSTETLNYSGVGSVDSPLISGEGENPTGITYFYYMEDDSGNIIESAVVDLVRAE